VLARANWTPVSRAGFRDAHEVPKAHHPHRDDAVKKEMPAINQTLT